MKVEIYEKDALEIKLNINFPDNTAIISFYDPDIPETNENKSRIDFSHKSIRVFTVALHDIDAGVLPNYGLTYDTYFPEAEALAKFIYSAYNDELDIICQSAYCQGRSAACAAAILEHFCHDGISVFANSYRYPNLMVFHKILDALEQFASEQTITAEEDRTPLPSSPKYNEMPIVSRIRDILVLTDDYCFNIDNSIIRVGIIAYVDLETNEFKKSPNSLLLFDAYTENFHISNEIEATCIYHLKAYYENIFNNLDFMVTEIIEKNASNTILEHLLDKYNTPFKITDDVVGNIIFSRYHWGFIGTFDYYGQQIELMIEKKDIWTKEIKVNLEI